MQGRRVDRTAYVTHIRDALVHGPEIMARVADYLGGGAP
jgi:hypothetical protein